MTDDLSVLPGDYAANILGGSYQPLAGWSVAVQWGYAQADAAVDSMTRSLEGGIRWDYSRTVSISFGAARVLGGQVPVLDPGTAVIVGTAGERQTLVRWDGVVGVVLVEQAENGDGVGLRLDAGGSMGTHALPVWIREGSGAGDSPGGRGLGDVDIQDRAVMLGVVSSLEGSSLACVHTRHRYATEPLPIGATPDMVEGLKASVDDAVPSLIRGLVRYETSVTVSDRWNDQIVVTGGGTYARLEVDETCARIWSAGLSYAATETLEVRGGLLWVNRGRETDRLLHVGASLSL